FFREIVALKTREFDPEKESRALQGQVICIELNPRSHLHKTVGNSSICGKFMGLNKGKSQTRVLSDDNKMYEAREAAFSFRLAYPDADHFVDVSLLDMVNIEPF